MAERLSDFKNLRRVEPKKEVPSQLSLHLNSTRFFYREDRTILQAGLRSRSAITFFLVALKQSQQAKTQAGGRAPQVKLLYAKSLTAVDRFEDAAQVLRDFLQEYPTTRMLPLHAVGWKA